MGYVLSSFTDFQCQAGDCRSTCCSGWKIKADKESYERYTSLEDTAFREVLLKNIESGDNDYYFINKPDGRCSMLRDDGLCEIQKRYGEKMLCNTCRKYPRLSGRISGDVWLSMSLSCPVIAEQLAEGSLCWYHLSEKKELSGVDIKEIPIFDGVFEYLRKNLDYMSLSDNIFILAENVLDIIIAEKTISLPENVFETFEYYQETICHMKDFQKKMIPFRRFTTYDYVIYRYPTMLIRKDAHEEKALLQIIGELSILYMFLFGRYVHYLKKNDTYLTKEDMTDAFLWTYRMCAHGGICREKRLERLFGNVVKMHKKNQITE